MRNEMEQTATLMDDGKGVSFELHSEEPRGVPPVSALMQEGESLPQAMKRIKAMMIDKTLKSCAGNRTRAARRLGISRPNLQKTMKRLGVN